MNGSQDAQKPLKKQILDIFANTQDGAYAVDGSQRIVFWNQSAQDMLGYTAEEALGSQCWQLLHGHSPDGGPLCREQCGVFERIAQGNSGDNFDVLVKHRDGHKVLINVSTLPLPHENNNLNEPSLMHLTRYLADQPMEEDQLRIHLLGPILVWRPNGTLVEGPLWRRIKVRALLAYLVLQRGPVLRETLMGVLWPDLDYAAGLRNLNTTIYNLRRSLEPDLKRGSDSQFVIYEGGQYYLNGGTKHWLDVDAFEKGFRRARVERDLHKVIEMYKETLSLYRGEFLTDLGNTQICSSGEQHRFHERYLSAMEELGVFYEQTQQDDEAKEIYLKIMGIDPCRETACQRLMRLLLRHDDMPSAAAHCTRLNEALSLELDMLPTPETRRLCKLAKCES